MYLTSKFNYGGKRFYHTNLYIGHSTGLFERGRFTEFLERDLTNLVVDTGFDPEAIRRVSFANNGDIIIDHNTLTGPSFCIEFVYFSLTRVCGVNMVYHKKSELVLPVKTFILERAIEDSKF